MRSKRRHVSDDGTIDTSHLDPDPVLCLADGWVCLACVATCSYDLATLGETYDWLARHRVCGRTR